MTSFSSPQLRGKSLNKSAPPCHGLSAEKALTSSTVLPMPLADLIAHSIKNDSREENPFDNPELGLPITKWLD
jgi:hypothetical protein